MDCNVLVISYYLDFLNLVGTNEFLWPFSFSYLCACQMSAVGYSGLEYI